MSNVRVTSAPFQLNVTGSLTQSACQTRGGQEGARRFTLLRVRVPAATAPDERGLHADFLGNQLQQNPFSVIHFRPQLFPAEKTSIKQYAPQQHKSTQQLAQR